MASSPLHPSQIEEGRGNAEGSQLSTRSQRKKSKGKNKMKNTFVFSGEKEENALSHISIEKLPDELLVHIFSYFRDGRSLLHLGSVNRRWNRLTQLDVLWIPVLRTELHLRRREIHKLLKEKKTARECYLSRVRHEDEIARAEYMEKIDDRRYRLQSLAMIADWFDLVFFFIFLILLVLKLDGNLTGSPWSAVFIPLWFMCLSSLLYLTLFEYNHVKYGNEFISDDGGETEQLFLEIVNEGHEGKVLANDFLSLHFAWSTFTSTTGRVITWLFFIFNTLWLMLLAGKLDGFEMPLYAVFFLPIFWNFLAIVFSIPGMFISCLNIWNKGRKVRGYSKFLICLATFFSGLFFGAFFVLVFSKLDKESQAQVDKVSDNRSWVEILSPLLLLEMLLFACSVMAFVCFFRNCKKSPVPLAYCGILPFGIPLIFGSQLLVGQKMDGNYDGDFSVCFAPIFVLQGLGICWLTSLHVGVRWLGIYFEAD